jgi:hypothetical protein
MQTCGPETKVGDKVVFLGGDILQSRWGSCDDPTGKITVGDILEVSRVAVHSYHTKLEFLGIKGKFNSVMFSPAY